MTFMPDACSRFEALFERVKDRIAAFDGCHHLQLWHDVQHPEIYFTWSVWESETHLDRYRFSELFKDTWAGTRILFAQKAEAWSLETKQTVK